MLQKLYTVTAQNIRKARESQPRQETPPMKLQVNDLVLVKDPEAAVFEPRTCLTTGSQQYMGKTE